jgi:hypothetical protein
MNNLSILISLLAGSKDIKKINISYLACKAIPAADIFTNSKQ